jgi:predicted metal-dependent phosphoesterase TrpH
LVQTAREHGVTTLALTDHDTTDGIAEALAAGRRFGVDVIAGVEINTDVGEHEVHILGYLVRHEDEDFQIFLRGMRDGRARRAEEMVGRLAALGVNVQWARIQEIADGAAVGRPHIARALVEAGRAGSPQEAFDRWLHRQGPAYVPRLKLAPEEAVAVVLRAGGVPVLAHPGWASSGPILDRLPQLVAHGLAGIEAYYPDHTDEMIATYRSAATRYGLVVTGGTDYHGGKLATRAPLGSVPVPVEAVPALRARHRLHGQAHAGKRSDDARRASGGGAEGDGGS